MAYKFLDLKTSTGNKVISVDSVALLDNSMGFAKITMKEKDENDNQIIINTSEKFEDVRALLYQK